MNFVNKKKIVKLILAIALFAIAIPSCSPEKQFQVLSFFFDGVPAPIKKPVVDSTLIENINADTSKKITKNVVVVALDGPSIHRPYEEHKCTNCHNGEFSNAIIKPVPYLCYTCHEDFNSKYQLLHGPVASGYCTACHDKHEAPHRKLLKAISQDLCFTCHEPKQILKNKKHEKIGKKDCTQCHDPHGGENRSFLKTGTCFNCHENFSAKYNFVHGPVVSGNCTACHDSHSSQKPKLLLRESQQICFFCHNEDQVFKNKAHLKAKKGNCTTCHNPHGGEDRFILTEALRPYTTKTFIKASNDSIPKEKIPLTEKPDSTSKNNVSKAPDQSDSTNTIRNIDSIKINSTAINAGRDSIKKDSVSIAKTVTEDSTLKKSINNSVQNNTPTNSIKKDSVFIAPLNKPESKNQDNLKEKIAIDSIFKKSDPIIEIKTEEGLHKYLNGSFYSLEEAVKYRDELVKKGYKDAFIVAYKNNKRVPNTSINTSNTKIEDIVIFRVQIGAFANEHPSDKNQKPNTISELDNKTNTNQDSTSVKPESKPKKKQKKTKRVPF